MCVKLNPQMEREKKTVFVGLDVMKFVCALLVVFLHTYNHDWGDVGEWIHMNLSPIGVPFFFIVSGFLYMGKLQDSQDKSRDYFLHYLRRVFYMYLFWSTITLPVAWINIEVAHGDYSLFMKLLYIIRCFFFTGSIGIYWYILALVYNCIIFFYAMKWNMMKVLYVLSVVLFIIGVLYDGGMIRETLLGKVIHVIIGSERNFLNVGLFYMCVGAIMVENKKLLCINIHVLCLLLLLCLVLSSYMNSISSYRIMQAPLAFLLFVFALRTNMTTLSGVSLKMRQWSTAIYFGHFPFILLFDYYLKRGTIIDYPVSILFALALYYVIKKISPERLTVIAYG